MFIVKAMVRANQHVTSLWQDKNRKAELHSNQYKKQSQLIVHITKLHQIVNKVGIDVLD